MLTSAWSPAQTFRILKATGIKPLGGFNDTIFIRSE